MKISKKKLRKPIKAKNKDSALRNKLIRKKSNKQEKRTAKLFKGRTQIASGAIPTLKGDVRTGSHFRTAGDFATADYLIENKYTESDFYVLTKETFEKIKKEATKDNFRTPLMQVDVKDVSLIICEDGLLQDTDLKLRSDLKTVSKSIRLRADIYDEIVGEYCYIKYEVGGLVLNILCQNIFMEVMEV